MKELKQNTRHISVAQINFALGDVWHNVEQVIATAKRAKQEQSAQLVVFPELTLTGYPPEDLLLRPSLHQEVEAGLAYLAAQLQDVDVVVGHPKLAEDKLYNAASLISQGQIVGTYYKQKLPNYSVFDEKRYFKAGHETCVLEWQGLQLGLAICEDLWHEGPMQLAKQAGAELMICLNASPFDAYKYKLRSEVFCQQARDHQIPIVYAHWVAGQDELVFDGGSFVVNAQGNIVGQAPFFAEHLLAVTVTKGDKTLQISCNDQEKTLSQEARIYQALVLGVRDYINKNGFQGALIGLSGGIDSALTLAIVHDAIGSDRVTAVMMPSQYTSQMSLDDAAEMAQILDVEYHVVSIQDCFNSFTSTLAPLFTGTATDITEENLQARTRGVILMALSNKFGKMVVTTGNKSEMAVGYATLYGDMAGGFNALKDVSKTWVYKLSHYRNSLSPVIPERIITRPPSAELAENQTDQDSLPPYDELDAILEHYIVNDSSIDEITALGFDKATVTKVTKMVDRNEYKRRQAPPGVKITTRAFGRDRRYPITSAFGRTKQPD